MIEPTPAKEHDETIEQAVQLLPPEIQDQVRDVIESLLAEQKEPSEATKPNLEWRGALQDLREQYASVELQHKAHETRMPLSAILERIDSIVLQLQELRRAVLTQQQTTGEDLAAALYGSWGQGTWDEYQMDIEWRRFSDE